MTDLLAELYRTLETDDSVLRALAERGDDARGVHVVEHHFLAPSLDVLQRISELGTRLGFRSADIGENDDGSYSCNLVSRTTLGAANIHRESLLMAFAAQAHGADYDGWGTYVEKQ